MLVVAREGFEPSLNESESFVLPLHYQAVTFGIENPNGFSNPLVVHLKSCITFGSASEARTPDFHLERVAN